MISFTNLVVLCMPLLAHSFKIRSAIPVRGVLRNMSMVSSFYDIVEKDANGNDFSFQNFKGKVVYGVNVASKCGYTASGYNLLSRIAQLKDKGVEVAIFPCNQFGGQVSLGTEFNTRATAIFFFLILYLKIRNQDRTRK